MLTFATAYLPRQMGRGGSQTNQPNKTNNSKPMTTTMKIPKQLSRHIFLEKCNGDETGREIASYGKTADDALEHCSGGAKQWQYIRTESLPYTHANLVAEICEHLPGNWFAKPDSDEHADCGWTITSNGLSLHVSPPSYDHRGQFRFSLSAGRSKGQYYVDVYDEKHNRVSYPSIGVSASKTAEQMAKDIARRLLPDAERVNAMVQDKITREANAENARLETLKQVCAVLGCQVPVHYYSKEPRFADHAGAIEFSVSYGGTVSLKLDCNLAQLAKIAEAMKS